MKKLGPVSKSFFHKGCSLKCILRLIKKMSEMDLDADLEDRKKTVQKILVSVPDYIQKVHCDTERRTNPFKCAVTSCPNIYLSFEERSKYPYKFHNFPKDADLCNTWKEKCGLSQMADISELKVCSDHFSLDDYIRNYKEEFVNPNFKRMLQAKAVPQKNLPVITADRGNVVDSSSSNDGLNFHDVKEAVDENEMLKKNYDFLVKKKSDMARKITIFNKKIASNVKEVKHLEELLGKDWIKSKNGCREKNILRKVFSDAQIKLLMGKKKVFWSNEDLAKAFTLRHIGGRDCYLYLKNTLNMPLPALSCVQKWAASLQNNSDIKTE